MLREELRRLVTWSERHRRLLARIVIAFSLSVVVDLIGAALMCAFESGLKGSQIHGFGDALFFATVQILTVSSSLKNPLTSAGQIVDVALEFWAIFVVTTVAGSFASFFLSGDQAPG
jgi:voltage-gated potassium channel